MADVVFFEPRRTSVLVSPAGSKKKLANHSAMRVAYKFIFPPNSNFYAAPEQMYGFIPEWGKIDVILYRNKGKPADETMRIQFAAAPKGEDPKESFATGQPVGEYAGETVVRLVAIE
ncbi:MSP domain-containing protein [Trichostrongylus colubriformis]|uniref:MSP domain-containing protein n=1 Tax=Trichostrongylus colubriformis TaxID=6319 RepID=A0AAN8FEJ5_TRICO